MVGGLNVWQLDANQPRDVAEGGHVDSNNKNLQRILFESLLSLRALQVEGIDSQTTWTGNDAINVFPFRHLNREHLYNKMYYNYQSNEVTYN